MKDRSQHIANGGQPSSRMAIFKGQGPAGDHLVQEFTRALRPIARRSVRVWFNRERLDAVLGEILSLLPESELAYAIDIGGRQVSSNLSRDRVNVDAYGQDLSQRPIAVPIGTLNDEGRRRAIVCDPYVSKATRQDCITVMHGVHSDDVLLGFIAVDMEPIAASSSAQSGAGLGAGS